jgi:phage gp36-like protein
MAYCTTDDIAAEVGGMQNLIPFTDDTNSQQLDTTVLSNIISVAQTIIDGRLGGIYTVPISPVVPMVRAAAITLTCERLYRRRLSPAEKNPYTEDAKEVMKWLDKIANNEASLDASVPRAFTPGFAHSRPTIYSSPLGGNNLSNSM